MVCETRRFCTHVASAGIRGPPAPHIETKHYIKMELRKNRKKEEANNSSFLNACILISIESFTGKFLNVGSFL
jgi:hypothetical protein